MLLLTNTAKTIFTLAKETRTFTGWISQGSFSVKIQTVNLSGFAAIQSLADSSFRFFNLVFLQTFKDIKTILCSMDCRKRGQGLY